MSASPRETPKGSSPEPLRRCPSAAGAAADRRGMMAHAPSVQPASTSSYSRGCSTSGWALAVAMVRCNEMRPPASDAPRATRWDGS